MRRVVLSSSRNIHSLNTSRVPYRHPRLQFSSYTSSDEDYKLHSSWTLWKWTKKIFELLFSIDKNNSFTKLMDKKICQPEEAVFLMSDFENPVMKKYSFDVYDFYHGAKIATEKVIQAAFSKDFKDYAMQKVTSSDSNDYLLDNVSPVTYMKLVILNQPAKDSKGVTYLLKVVRPKVTKFRVVRAVSFMQDPEREEYFLDSFLSKNLRYYIGSFLGFIDKKSGFFIEDYSPLKETLGPAYFEKEKIAAWYDTYFPRGSVCLAVSSLFLLKMDIEMLRPKDLDAKVFDYNDDNNWEFEKSNVLEVNCSATFMGCISGQKELEWKIARLDVGIGSDSISGSKVRL